LKSLKEMLKAEAPDRKDEFEEGKCKMILLT
jgi:hypothetical protein